MRTTNSLFFLFLAAFAGGCSLIKVKGLPSLPTSTADEAKPTPAAPPPPQTQAVAAPSQTQAAATPPQRPAAKGLAAWRQVPQWTPDRECKSLWVQYRLRLQEVARVTLQAQLGTKDALERLAEKERRVEAAEGPARTCLADPEVVSARKFPEVQAQVATTEQEIPLAKQRGEQLRAGFVVIDEGKALSEAMRVSDGSDFDALTARQKAYVAHYQEAAATNPTLTPNWLAEHNATAKERLGTLAAKSAALRQQADVAAYLKRLRDNSVVQRFPKLTEADAFDPAKIAQVFLQADPEWFVVTTGIGDCDYTPGKFPRAKTWDGERKEGPVLQRFNDTFTGLDLFYNQDLFTELPKGTLGLVWELKEEHNQVLFVSVDGGRYQMDLRGIEPDRRKASALPQTPHRTGMMLGDIYELSDLGVLPKGLHATMEKADKAFEVCAEKTWTRAEPAFDRLRQQNVLPHVLEARLDALREKTRGDILKRCAGPIQTFVKNWRVAAKTYDSERTQALAKVRKRVAALPPPPAGR